MSNHQRRVRIMGEDTPPQSNQSQEPIAFEDAVIAVSDETTWVLVGETWVDTSRIITVSPLEAIWDESQGAEGTPRPTGGVAVQLDSPHPDSQFVQTEDDSVEEIMTRILDATTDGD